MGDESARLFVAIALPPAVRTALGGVINELARQADGSFTHVRNMHLTMAFIGETSRVGEAIEAVRAASGRPAFEIKVGGVGRFGDLWWVAADGGEPLMALSDDLRVQLEKRGLPYDRKPFHPHITVARRVKAVCRPKLSSPTTVMTALRLSLMRSDRIEGRLTYTEVAGFDFGK